MHQPSLSICIPTKNRPSELANSLASIVTQEFFKTSDDVNITILDSSDSEISQNVCNPIKEQFPRKIFYYKNDADGGDRNFEKVLRLAKGKFRKLANDTLIWRDGSVHLMHAAICKIESTRPLFFVLNGACATPQPFLTTQSIDQFIKTVSYHCTWIGSFGIWDSDLDEIEDFSRASQTQLIQVDVIFRVLSKRPIAVIANDTYYSVQPSPAPKDYDLAKVFGTNYLAILNQYSSSIKPETYAFEKRSILTEHILPLYFRFDNNFLKHPLDHLHSEYKTELYFQESLDNYRANFFRYCHHLPIAELNSIWRRLNHHNETFLQRNCDISRIKVGRYSYGSLSVHGWNARAEHLSIGHFVSLAENVRFLLGGNHPIEGFSSFPFNVKLGRTEFEAMTKGPISIGDDVWIGTGATILSGSTVGQGAVIGSGSVVAGTIPPYAIAVGSPARVVKYRHSPEIRRQLMQFDFSTFDPAKVPADFDFYTPLTEENVARYLNALRQWS